jgi:hypothetical protein
MWDIMWDCVVKAYSGAFSNFIIIGQTGIGVHHFLHIFFLPSADITHQGRLSLYYFLAKCLALSLTTFFQDALDYVLFFDKSGVRPIDANILWVEIQGLLRATKLGPSSIQIILFKTLPLFYLPIHHHFLSWKHCLLVRVDGLGRNTMGALDSSTRILSSLEEILQGVYIHLFCKIMSSYLHCMKGIWFNPNYPMKLTYETSSSSMVHLPMNVMVQPLPEAASNHVVSNFIKL